MKLSLLVFSAVLFSLVSFAYAHSEDTSYPIAELGNCASQEECAQYCGLQENWQACGDFARNHEQARQQEQTTVRTLQYPVAELDNCASENECREFCNNPENMEACVSFAEENGFMSAEDVARSKQMAKQYMAGQFSGPAGCDSPESCRTYCENPDNHNSCIDWGVENGHMSKEDAERAKRFGPNFQGPNGCQGREQCEAYCSENVDECVNWAVENGMMSGEEAERARRMAAAINNGPGGCKGMSACRDYCENPDNMPACIDWAIENGFVTGEEAEKMKRMAQAMQNGPGGCSGPRECEIFCNRAENMQTCIGWACDNGMMNAEQCRIAKEFSQRAATGFEGPGGCSSPEECEAYCRENFQACSQWASQMAGQTQVPAESFPTTTAGALPPGCTERGLGQEECAQFCGENPEECVSGFSQS